MAQDQLQKMAQMPMTSEIYGDLTSEFTTNRCEVTTALPLVLDLGIVEKRSD
jgi:hypothetical protein